MDIEPNIIAFHVNEEVKSNKFLSSKELVLFEDTHYLGTGMYFWDNKSNADYWVEKKKKDGVNPIYVSKCNILLSPPLLDMTDKEVINRVERFWQNYCNKINEKKTNQHLGTILDVLYAVFPEIYGQMKVSKAHGFYNSRFLHSFLYNLGKNTYVDNSHKTIYCVRCSSKIVNQELFYIKND
jgi:hypothetical protein